MTQINATGFCFNDKDVAISALRGALDQAELLGKTNGCYVAIYQDYDVHVPDLKPRVPNARLRSAHGQS